MRGALLLLAGLLAFSLHAGEAIKGPSEADFLREIFDSRPSEKTADFQDRPDGYSIDKPALQKALVEYAQKQGVKLRAFVFFGPIVAQWSYHVIVFIDEGTQVRVNTVYFPKSRIEYKSSGLLSREKFAQFEETLLNLPPSEKPAGVGEAAQPLWFCRKKDNQKEFETLRNSLVNNTAGRSFEKAYSQLLLELTQTYPKKPE